MGCKEMCLQEQSIKLALSTVVGRKTAPLKKASAKVRSKQPTRSSKKVKFISEYIIINAQHITSRIYLSSSRKRGRYPNVVCVSVQLGTF